jgi:hypothetical protein
MEITCTLGSGLIQNGYTLLEYGEHIEVEEDIGKDFVQKQDAEQLKKK